MGDKRDFIGGALLLALGSLIAWRAAQTLDLGTVRRMGPGMFPFWIGLLLAVAGAGIFLAGFLGKSNLPAIEWRAGAAVLGAFAVFALIVTPFGLLPAIIGLVAVSSLAEQRLRPGLTLVMCLLLPLLAWLVFKVGLGLPLTMVRWPF